MRNAQILILAALFFFPPELSTAQQMKIIRKGPGGAITKEFSQDQLLNIPELSAMILEQERKLVVDHIMEREMRMKGYEDTDLQEGDRILMANGKRIGNLQELRDLYTNAAPGSAVKLGVKRKSETIIASFVKADPKNLPKTRMIISGGDDQEMIGIPQIGLVLKKKGNEVVVDHVLDNAAKELKAAEIKEGDVIITLNTFPVRSFNDFQKRYEKIPAGDKVELIAKRADKTKTIAFAKPKEAGNIMIRR